MLAYIDVTVNKAEDYLSLLLHYSNILLSLTCNIHLLLTILIPEVQIMWDTSS